MPSRGNKLNWPEGAEGGKKSLKAVARLKRLRDMVLLYADEAVRPHLEAVTGAWGAGGGGAGAGGGGRGEHLSRGGTGRCVGRRAGLTSSVLPGVG